MLPSRHRLKDSFEFRAAVRGRRAGGKLLVVHGRANPTRQGRPTRVGLVVSRAVGNAVTRNRVKRRLRHHMATRLDHLPDGYDVVLRANPAAALAPYQTLSRDLDRLLSKVVPAEARHPNGDNPHTGGAS